MRRVIVDMQNTLFSDAIGVALRNFDFDFDVILSEKPSMTLDLCIDTKANILIMEVTGYQQWSLEERLKIRNALKEQMPECKIALVVDENTDKKLADRVRLMKKDGLIDNFIYGSVSSTYLSAVIDTL